jgi:hypothetical protein
MISRKEEWTTELSPGGLTGQVGVALMPFVKYLRPRPYFS